MYTNAQALDAARLLRSRLPQELDVESAQVVDRQLAELLNQTELDENTQVDQILQLLDSYPDIKILLDHLLSDPSTLKYADLVGNPSLQSAQKYICPIGNDFTWYREGNEEVPRCPTHLVTLIPTQA